MSKNLIPQIAQMLGVEIGEEFQIKEYGERIYRFANSGLQLIYDNGVRNLNEIVKLPWKPAYRQEYWTFGLKDGIWVVVPREWEDYPAEILLADKGWTYRTREEAEAALPGVAKELGVEHKL